MSDSLIAAQLNATNGAERRSLSSWIWRAINSLPVPVSPMMRAVASLGAMRWTRSRSDCDAGSSKTRQLARTESANACGSAAVTNLIEECSLGDGILCFIDPNNVTTDEHAVPAVALLLRGAPAPVHEPFRGSKQGLVDRQTDHDDDEDHPDDLIHGMQLTAIMEELSEPEAAQDGHIDFRRHERAP